MKQGPGSALSENKTPKRPPDPGVKDGHTGAKDNQRPPLLPGKQSCQPRDTQAQRPLGTDGIHGPAYDSRVLASCCSQENTLSFYLETLRHIHQTEQPCWNMLLVLKCEIPRILKINMNCGFTWQVTKFISLPKKKIKHDVLTWFHPPPLLCISDHSLSVLWAAAEV